MAFDEVRLPLRLKYGSRGGPQFMTEIVAADSGFEKRNQRWAQARRRYDARSGVISAADAAMLMSFFHARCGRARGFRLKDWSDFSSAADGRSAPGFEDQVIAVGDGVQTVFQLSKLYGDAASSYRRTVSKPVAGSVRIGVNGVEMMSGWSLDEMTGAVSFAAPPAAGARVSAGFYFDVPVRFDTDVLNLTAEDKNLALAEIPLIEVRTV